MKRELPRWLRPLAAQVSSSLAAVRSNPVLVVLTNAPLAAKKDVQKNMRTLRYIDDRLSTTLAKTNRELVHRVYGALWEAHLRRLSWITWVYSVPFLLLSVLLLWGLLREVSVLVFAGSYGGLIILSIAYGAGASWLRSRSPEYFTFYYLMAALRSLSEDDALSAGKLQHNLISLRRAAGAVANLKVRANSASREVQPAATKRTTRMAAGLHQLQQELIFPSYGSLGQTRQTLVHAVERSLLGNFGELEVAEPVEARPDAFARMRTWAAGVAVTFVVTAPFVLIGFLLTGGETSLDAIVNPDGAVGYAALIIYGAAAITMAAKINPTFVGNLDLVRTLIPGQK